jgi:acetyltransferase-like isoleucine patch superfamily enzyme
MLYRLYLSLRKKFRKWEVVNSNKFLNNKIKSKNIVRFAYNVNINKLEKIQFGQNIFIGENAYIRADGGLSIGNNVSISKNVVIYTKIHNYNGVSLPYDDTFIYKPVVIEDNCWIGINVTIAPGTFIGEGSIIGMGANVFGKIEPYSIIGSDGKLLKYRDKEHYKKLVNENKFADDSGRLIRC